MFDMLLDKTASHFTLVRDSRRKTERLHCDRSLFGSFVLPNKKSEEIWVRDLSVAGIGIITSKPVPIDRDAVIGLKRSNAGAVNCFPVRVIYCSAESACCWYVGCMFKEPLEPSVLQYLAG